MMPSWLTSWRSTSRSISIGERDHDRRPRWRDGDPERHPLRSRRATAQRGEQHHRALGEVEHARRLEDQHEAQRDQRIEHARQQAAEQHFEEETEEPQCERCRTDASTVRREAKMTPVASMLRQIGIDHAWFARTSSGMPSPIFLP